LRSRISSLRTEPREVHGGGEFPIVINTATGGTAAYSIEYKDYGVRLNFKPKISSNGEIYLQVYQEVSELDFANAVVLQGFRIPALKTRKAESGLQLADGQTFVLAGSSTTRCRRRYPSFRSWGISRSWGPCSGTRGTRTTRPS